MNLLTLIALGIIAELFTVVYNDQIVYFYKISRSQKENALEILKQSSSITYIILMHSVFGFLYIILILVGVFTGVLQAYLLLVLSLAGFVLIKKNIISLGFKPYIYMDAFISISILIWWGAERI
ncbi:MAG: hypothetical protein ACQEQC_07230 [Elusimicrobiota bacterium]